MKRDLPTPPGAQPPHHGAGGHAGPAPAPAPAPPASPASRATVLLVDDEPANLLLLNDIFHADYRVLVATRAEQALALCVSEQPDLVLLDVLMPGTDGYAACQRLKADPRTRDIPVIFVTGQSDPRQETLAIELGAADFISKPFNASVVRARAQLQLTLREHRLALERSIEDAQRSQAQAEAANRATSEFLSAISHELRTPLTSIRGFAELMETRIDDPVYRRQAGLMRRAAEHLHQLLSELLDLSKLEAGAMAVVTEPVALRQLVHDTGEFFQITAKSKGLQLEIDVAESVPEQALLDGMRIKQILNNLLSNAFKFTTQGSVRIELTGDAHQLYFAVIDSGPGIAPELQGRIFEKFKQAGPEVARQHGGTGLGLALSRGLAERMGGTLGVQSKPGRGARFILTLPLNAAGGPA